MKGATEDEMVEWPHEFKGLEFEQTLGDNEGQGSLCAAVHGCRESGTTERLNSNKRSRGGEQSIAVPRHPRDSTLKWSLGA